MFCVIYQTYDIAQNWFNYNYMVLLLCRSTKIIKKSQAFHEHFNIGPRIARLKRHCLHELRPDLEELSIHNTKLMVVGDVQ